jgi:YegS/Rv2252/BmrU family lipid kinase
MKERAVLLNPSSGMGRSIREKKKIENYFIKNNIEYDLFVSRNESHLRQLAQETVEDYPVIIGVGGDTTFNIIAKEIIRSEKDISFGAIGTGSTNDFVRGLGIQKTVAACDAIKREEIKKIDIGKIRIRGNSETYYYLAQASLGLGTTLNKYVEDFNKKIFTRLKATLLVQTIPGILGIHNSFSKKRLPRKLLIEYDQISEEHNIALLAFLNTPYIANGMRLIPDASPFDGKINACILDTSSFFKSIKVGILSYRGKHLKQKGIKLIKTDSIKVYTERPMDLQIDGFILSDIEEFEVSVVPKALKIFL